MKLEHIINVDFANLVHSDEYDFDAEAMPDYCKVTDCTVMNYREYYRKAHILKYTNAQTPYWIA